jgi:hypothetical protein
MSQVIVRASGHDASVVEDGYAIGQFVALFEVLRGEEDRAALGAQRRTSSHSARLLWASGRWSVHRETTLGAVEERTGEIEPAAQGSAGVARWGRISSLR